MPNITDFRPADWAVLGTSGFVFILATLCMLYAFPWRRYWRRSGSLNALWPTRALLECAIAALIASQVARLYSLLWNHGSPISSNKVTDWTSEGWMCRIYLTAGLGVFAPLTSFLAIFILNTGRRTRSEERLGSLGYGNTAATGRSATARYAFVNVRILGLALACCLPVALLQAAIAWVGVWVHWRGQSFEDQPRSVPGYFLATFWYGNAEECGSRDDEVASDAHACVLCVFPAAAAVVHLMWTIAFLGTLWNVSFRLAETALNRAIKRRLRVFACMLTVFAAAGCAAMGASVAWGPYTWINQGLWLGYFASVAASSILITLEIVFLPVKAAHVASRTMLEWQRDADTGVYADITVSLPPYSNQPSPGSKLWASTRHRARGKSAPPGEPPLVEEYGEEDAISQYGVDTEDEGGANGRITPTAPPFDSIPAAASAMLTPSSSSQRFGFAPPGSHPTISSLHRSGSAASIGTPHSTATSVQGGVSSNVYGWGGYEGTLAEGGGGGGGGGVGVGGRGYVTPRTLTPRASIQGTGVAYAPESYSPWHMVTTAAGGGGRDSRASSWGRGSWGRSWGFEQPP